MKRDFRKPRVPIKTTDWSDDPDFKTFAEQALRDAAPKIADSAYVFAVAPPKGQKADIKQAVEIGLCILYDKPLVVLKPVGRVVPERLLRIADHVVEGDIETEAGKMAIAAKLKALMTQ